MCLLPELALQLGVHRTLCLRVADAHTLLEFLLTCNVHAANRHPPKGSWE